MDEIGEMPLEAQVRLLRVLQHREIERLGGTKRIPVDIRIIAATNKDLPELVRSGTFREDLFFRLNVFPISIPALRERVRDIPALVQHFLDRKAKELDTILSRTHPKTHFEARSSEKLVVKAGGGKGSEACWSTSRTFFADNADPRALQPTVAGRGFGMGSSLVSLSIRNRQLKIK